MSHNIEYRDYEAKVNKKAVQKKLDDYVAHMDWQEGATGLANPIRWIDDKVFDTREEAVKYIDEHDRGWYDQIAVKYLEIPESKMAGIEKLKELRCKVDAAAKEYRSINEKVHYSDCKSEFIGCKACGSRIAKAFLKSNNCPVCRAEMRPQSALDAIKRAYQKSKDAASKYEEEKKKVEAKNKKNAEERWLVKIEYHT